MEMREGPGSGCSKAEQKQSAGLAGTFFSIRLAQLALGSCRAFEESDYLGLTWSTWSTAKVSPGGKREDHPCLRLQRSL